MPFWKRYYLKKKKHVFKGPKNFKIYQYPTKKARKRTILDPHLVSGRRRPRKIAIDPLVLTNHNFFNFFILFYKSFFSFGSWLVLKRQKFFWWLFFIRNFRSFNYTFFCLQTIRRAGTLPTLLKSSRLGRRGPRAATPGIIKRAQGPMVLLTLEQPPLRNLGHIYSFRIVICH